LLCSYLISAVYSPELSSALVTIIQLALVLFWVLFISLLPWDVTLTAVAYVLFVLFVLVNATIWCIEGFNSPFTGFLQHKNVFGAVLFSGAFFLILFPLHPVLSPPRVGFRTRLPRLGTTLFSAAILAVACLLLWASGSRTAQLSIIATVLTYAAWPRIVRSTLSHVSVFLAIVVSTIGGVFFYVSLSQYSIFDSLREIAQRYSGAELYSGRELLWPMVLDHISQKPIFGWGAGFREEEILSDFLGEATHAHNLYLAVALQTGIMGLVLLFGVLYSIWSIYRCPNSDRVVRLSAAFFVGILFHQWFELSLTQNNVSVGVLFWTIIGLGMNRALLLQVRRIDSLPSTADHRSRNPSPHISHANP